MMASLNLLNVEEIEKQLKKTTIQFQLFNNNATFHNGRQIKLKPIEEQRNQIQFNQDNNQKFSIHNQVTPKYRQNKRFPSSDWRSKKQTQYLWQIIDNLQLNMMLKESNTIKGKKQEIQPQNLIAKTIPIRLKKIEFDINEEKLPPVGEEIKMPDRYVYWSSFKPTSLDDFIIGNQKKKLESLFTNQFIQSNLAQLQH